MNSVLLVVSLCLFGLINGAPYGGGYGSSSGLSVSRPVMEGLHEEIKVAAGYGSRVEELPRVELPKIELPKVESGYGSAPAAPAPVHEAYSAPAPAAPAPVQSYSALAAPAPVVVQIYTLAP